MNPKLIVIDGKTYKSVDEMPEDVRRSYESAMRQLADNDKNGVPDALENMNILADKNKDGIPDAFGGMASNVISTSTKIIADGKEYSSLDELPPDIRAKYDQAMGTLDSNRNGVPDFLEGMMNVPQQTSTVQTNFGSEHPQHSFFDKSKDKPKIVTSTIEPESTSGWSIALIGILLFGLCAIAAIGAWYFFLR